MPEAGVNSLAAQKQALVTQAALHRQVILVERLQLELRVEDVRSRLHSHRWWLIGGAVGAGLLLQRARGLLSLLPLGIAAWKAWQGLASDKTPSGTTGEP